MFNCRSVAGACTTDQACCRAFELLLLELVWIQKWGRVKWHSSVSSFD